MKRVHLLRTSAAPEEFTGLFAALREIGLRAGWLDLAETSGPDASSAETAEVLAALEAAASAGAFRAVGVGGGRVVTVKPVSGPSVLKDLLREHLSGCRLVVVRGLVEAPEIVPVDDGWQVSDGPERRKTLTTVAVAKALRKPGFPFGASQQ